MSTKLLKMKPRLFLLLFVLFVSVTGIQAQDFSPDFWHNGEADLESGLFLKGKMKYSLDGDNLQIVEGKVIKSYSAENVSAFEIMDVVTKRTRYFYSLPYKIERYQKRHFFELLSEGSHLTLLTREKLVEKIENEYNPYWTAPYGTQVKRRIIIEYDFFLMDKFGEIKQVNLRKVDTAISMMKDFKKKLIPFIDVNKLDFRDREDYMQIVNYYNRLKKEREDYLKEQEAAIEQSKE